MSKFFFCIGAQKAATSWLHFSLHTHPDFYLPPVKELHFFNDTELGRSVFPNFFSSKPAYKTWRKELVKVLFSLLIFRKVKENKKKLRQLLNRKVIRELGVFNILMGVSVFRIKLRMLLRNLIQFKDVRNSWRTLRILFLKRSPSAFPKFKKLLAHKDYLYSGDITPAYSTISASTVAEVYKHFPDAKIVFIMRNPVEREWSSAKMNYIRDIGLTMETYDKDKVRKQLQKFNIRSQYLQTIENWRSSYPDEQLFLCFYEDIAEDSLGMFNKVLDFMEIEQVSELPLTRKVNKGTVGEMPEEFGLILYNKYLSMIGELAELYESSPGLFRNSSNNYFQSWLEEGQAFLAQASANNLETNAIS